MGLSTAPTGSLPDTLSSLQRLERLFLCDNALQATIPDGLHKLSNLDQVLLNSCFLSGTIPEGIQSWKSLIALMLHSNSFAGSVPSLPSSKRPVLWFSMETILSVFQESRVS